MRPTMAGIVHVVLTEMPNCPRCDSQYIRGSHSRKIMDFLVELFFDTVPFRCRKCRLRFYQRQPEETTFIREAAALKQWSDVRYRAR